MKKSVLMLFVLLSFFSCSNESDGGESDGFGVKGDDNPRQYINMVGNYGELSVANSDFAFDLFVALNEDVGDNGTALLLSPISASFALGMLNNGAANGARDDLMSVLSGGSADISEMNEYYRTLMFEMPTLDNTATLKIANSQWTVPSLSLLSDYSSTISCYFDAELNTLDIATAVSDINNWCGENTDGLINDFYSDIDPDVQTILLNAIYFKGVWTNKFDKKKTGDGQFTNYNGSESTVSYMTANITALGHEEENYCVLSLPFGNNAFSMQILLPDNGVSLSECIRSLDTGSWLEWENSEYKEFDILLPKFSVEYKSSLVSVLEGLGLASLFEGSDFSNMSSDDIYIDEISQATIFTIDEDGVEAAAVTGSGMEGSAGYEKGEFHVTHPFLYIIKENSTNTILFIGRVTEL